MRTLLLAVLAALPVSAQSFSPVVAFSVHDQPVDGLGNAVTTIAP